MTRIVTVLPPKEGFSPGAVGAIGLLVHRLAAAAGGDVVGRAVADPFADVAFHPVTPGRGLSATSRYAAGVARILRSLDPALVEVHNRPEIALRLARHFPRVVLFLHNDPLDMRGARTARGRAVLFRRLAGIVAVSCYLRSRLADAPPGLVRVLANSIDVPPATMPEREKLILFVGRVVADKGADAFVAACAAALPRLPGWRAEMVGADRFSPDSPDTPFLQRLRGEAAQAGVALLGYRPHDDAMERLGRAAIAIVPSRWPEPFGLAALEAMAHGAALICSRRGGLPEVAGDAALYADPDAPGALAEAVVRLAADPDQCGILAAAGRAQAARFGTQAAAAALQAFRRDILTRPAMQPRTMLMR